VAGHRDDGGFRSFAPANATARGDGCGGDEVHPLVVAGVRGEVADELSDRVGIRVGAGPLEKVTSELMPFGVAGDDSLVVVTLSGPAKRRIPSSFDNGPLIDQDVLVNQ